MRAYRFHKVINEPDALPLHIVRLLAEAAKLARTQRGSWWRRRSGNLCSAMRGRGAYRRSCSILRSGTWISVFRPRAARLMAPDGMALVDFGRRLAVQRETDAALHHPGACDAFGNVGPDALRDGGQDLRPLL